MSQTAAASGSAAYGWRFRGRRFPHSMFQLWAEVPLGVPATRRRNDQYLRPDGRVRSVSGVVDRSDYVAGGGGGVVVRVSLVGGFWTRTRTVARGQQCGGGMHTTLQPFYVWW
jgi:hypothetical protein